MCRPYAVGQSGGALRRRPATRPRRSSSTSRATRSPRRAGQNPVGAAAGGTTAGSDRRRAGGRRQGATPAHEADANAAERRTAIAPCNTADHSGGAGVPTNTHVARHDQRHVQVQLRRPQPCPDRFQIVYEGQTLLDTGFVSGASTRDIAFSGSSTTVTVTVTALRRVRRGATRWGVRASTGRLGGLRTAEPSVWSAVEESPCSAEHVVDVPLEAGHGVRGSRVILVQDEELDAVPIGQGGSRR